MLDQAYPKGVTRLFLAILIALSFVSGPATAVAAPAATCTMTGPMDSDADHSTMDCCTPACAVSCPPALIPMGGAPAPSDEVASAALWMPAAEEHPSFNPSALDPPPKFSFA